jgi:hypothetical protein
MPPPPRGKKCYERSPSAFAPAAGTTIDPDGSASQFRQSKLVDRPTAHRPLSRPAPKPTSKSLEVSTTDADTLSASRFKDGSSGRGKALHTDPFDDARQSSPAMQRPGVRAVQHATRAPT